MKNNYLIIDGNNLLHRAFHKFKNMKSSAGVNSSIIFGFPYILNSLINTLNPDRVIVVFDGGRHKKRLKILPDYKKREKRDDFDFENFIAQKEEVQNILTCLGIPYTWKKGWEADDIIWLLVRRIKRKGDRSIIVSTDKDFFQLLNKRTSIWNAFKNKRITHKNLENIAGYKPELTVDYLILDGDSSDKIPGYPGVGPKRAMKLLTEYGSIQNYLNNDSSIKGIDKDKLREIYNRNRELIDLRYFARKNKLSLKLINITYPKKIDTRELAMIASKYDITTFSKANFKNTFKKLSLWKI